MKTIRTKFKKCCAWIRSRITRCQCCGCLGAETHRQNTRYVNDEQNIVTLCPCCREENDQHWAEMWSDYYSGCL